MRRSFLELEPHGMTVAVHKMAAVANHAAVVVDIDSAPPSHRMGAAVEEPCPAAGGDILVWCWWVRP